MRYLFATSFVLLLFGAPWLADRYSLQTPGIMSTILTAFDRVGDQIATIIMVGHGKTVEELRSKYDIDRSKSRTQVRILIVPGHEPDYGGAEFGTLREREVVVDIADQLSELLRKNPRYEVFVTRDNTSWKPEFQEYFKNHWEEIVAWKNAHKSEETKLINVGRFKTYVSPVEHNTAPNNVAIRLYGINKWVQDNDIDIVLHLHLNDYPRRRVYEPGSYSGFSIYVPEKQYINSTTTRALALTIFGRLSKYSPVSDFAAESSGIVEDQELIAIGPYNTVGAASMLIEYGYIYESNFTNREVRPLAVHDMAYQTYTGLLDFFDPASVVNLDRFYDTLALPYTWSSELVAESPQSADIFALQTALMLDGVYPPVPSSKNDCPRTGKLGVCTKKSLDLFQKKYGITDEKDRVGKKTVEVLNRTYGVDSI
jgi:N-acetylmuramoyl-L-alanine amidase